MVLVPGLLASGIGYMVFIGLNSWTGFGTFSLSIPNLAHLPAPTIAELGWAVVIGLGATVLGGGIRWTALFVRPFVERNLVLFTPLAGAAVAGIAIAFAEGTGQSYAAVLFSGQNELAPFTAHAASWSVGALVAVVALQGAGLRHLAEQLPGRPDLSRRCSSAPPAASPSRTCRDSRWWRVWPWGSVPCPPSCSSFP